MAQKRRTLLDSFSTRVARTRKKSERNRVIRLLGPRGAATLLLGTALSIGGISETMQHTHFIVQKDLDHVRVVRQRDGGRARVVASVEDAFAANTLFKLSRALPERYVTREIALFNDDWFSSQEQPKEESVFYTEMRKLNVAIRRDFFANAMPYGDIIHEKAEKYDVDPALVAAVIEAESRFHKHARSQVGAQGLMQLMPRTGRWMGARDLYDPEQNIDAGVRYIKYLNERFHGNLKKTIAAYNAGEGNVKRYGGVPPFRETQKYVKKVLRNYDKRTKELKEYENRGGSVPEADGTLTLR